MLALLTAGFAWAGDIGINLYGASYHFERDRARELGLDNQFNPGLGVRYRQSSERMEWLADAGIYHDSAEHTAMVVGVGAWWKAGQSLRLGAAIALFKSETYNGGPGFGAVAARRLGIPLGYCKRGVRPADCGAQRGIDATVLAYLLAVVALGARCSSALCSPAA